MKSTSALALLAAAGMMIGGVSLARAADLNGDDKSDADVLKKFVEGDGPLTVHGITVYGTFDAGWTSLDHGSNSSDFSPTTQPFIIQKYSQGSSSGLVASPLEQSKFGIKGTEDLGAGFAAVFKLETGFNPLTGNLTDGVKSVAVDNGILTTSPNYVSQNDSSRAGQFFEGAAWGGVSHKDFGTLTYGRQNAILLDTMGAYDPMGGSYAFGLIGFSGTFGGGGGDTQNARLDNSIRYANKFGDAGKGGAVRVGGEYQFATQTDGGEGYQGLLGVDYKGFSIDGVYAHKVGGISASSLNAADVGALGALGLSSNNTINATLSDNTTWAITAKYDGGPWKVMGGYENISQINSNNPQNIAQATTGGAFMDIGGYDIFKVTNNKYDSSRVSQMYWVGGKYNFTPKFSGTVAYYHVDQNEYLNGAGAGTGCNGLSGTAALSNCSGKEDVYSLLLDYQWTKRLDVYGGVMGSTVSDGLSSGFNNTSATAVTIGSRVKF